MQMESQVLLREFNRRLRSTLGSAPNHVRVETALEVESHVMDVLDHHKSNLSEPERVAEILAGFGTPEEYAKAIMAQLPGVQVVSVHTGAREVGLAAVDLMSGFSRLLVAVIRRFGALLMTALHCLRIGAVWTQTKLRWGARMARGPARAVLFWLGHRANQMQRSAHVLHLGVSRRVHDTMAASRGARRLAATLFRSVVSVLRRTLQAAVYIALGVVSLGAFALAGVTALAPDLVGFGIYRVQTDIQLFLTDLRRQTVFHFDPSMQEHFTTLGSTMILTMLLLGLAMSSLILLLVWNSRRRRPPLSDHS